MARRDQLGNFELMVTLVLIRLRENAYGVPISDELEKRTGCEVAIASVYAALERLSGGELAPVVLATDCLCPYRRFMVASRHAEVAGVAGHSSRLDVLVLMLPLIEGYVFLFLKDETFSRYNPHNWWTLGGSVVEYYDWWFVLIAPFAVSLLGGWLVARSHRRSQRAMVLAFFASRCAIALPLVCFLLIGMFVERLYLPGLIKVVFANAVTLPGILLGGGMFGGSREVRSSGRGTIAS